MKIYFAHSIRGEQSDPKLLAQVSNYLKRFGDVLTSEGVDDESLSNQFIHARDMEWLSLSDVIVAEISDPSLGVGYEIRRAVEMQKRVLCLYRKQEKKLSAMIAGSPHPILRTYRSIEEAFSAIDDFFRK
jgi:hypothetical protein